MDIPLILHVLIAKEAESKRSDTEKSKGTNMFGAVSLSRAILSSTGAGVWRKFPEAVPPFSSALGKVFTSASCDQSWDTPHKADSDSVSFLCRRRMSLRQVGVDLLKRNSLEPLCLFPGAPQTHTALLRDCPKIGETRFLKFFISAPRAGSMS